MAITKILYRNGGLAQAIQYITNPDKTDQCVLVDHFNCDPGFAYQQMMNTKRRFHKTDGRQCYHIIQSFKPDEITPELAHEIAKRFAAEHLRGYEAVIGTHVDKGHIHSHIVFNSVNADTGIKYHSTLQNYYQQIRGISDRLCAENGLSVILQGERTKTVSYIEWLRQSKGQPTFRSMLEADLRDAITDANDLGHFFLLMEHKGYEIHHGNRLGFRLRGQERYMYPERKNAAFSEENIERAIAGNLTEIEAGIRPAFIQRPKPQPYRPHPKYKGFLALYYAQAFQALYYSADQIHHGPLPRHVRFVLDEFAAMPLPGFTRELATMRSRSISASVIIQNMAQIKELYKDSWETIPGNCDTILYLGGNESSTHKYVSEMLGKATIDTKTHGQTKGKSGSYSTNFQMSGRELLTPDEVRKLDNRYALLFIRGASPVMDEKYDLMHHPAISHSSLGGAAPYIHHGTNPPIYTGRPLLRVGGTENSNPLKGEFH